MHILRYTRHLLLYLETFHSLRLILTHCLCNSRHFSLNSKFKIIYLITFGAWDWWPWKIYFTFLGIFHTNLNRFCYAVRIHASGRWNKEISCKVSVLLFVSQRWLFYETDDKIICVYLHSSMQLYIMYTISIVYFS